MSGPFRFVLPPGWAHIDTAKPLDATIARFAPALPDADPATQEAIDAARAALRQRLSELTMTARRGGPSEFLLPTRLRGGGFVPVSIALSRSLARRPAGHPLPEPWASATFDEVPLEQVTARRWERRERRVENGTRVESVRVDHLIPALDGDADRPGLLTSTTVMIASDSARLPDDAIALLVRLGDAIVATFRWRDARRR